MVIPHQKIVKLPALPFTALARQRAFLTDRPNARHLFVYAASVVPPPPPLDGSVRDGTERTWATGAMSALFVLLLVLCGVGCVVLH